MFFCCIDKNNIEASVRLDDIQVMEIPNNSKLVKLIIQINYQLNQTTATSEDSIYIIRQNIFDIDVKKISKHEMNWKMKYPLNRI